MAGWSNGNNSGFWGNSNNQWSDNWGSSSGNGQNWGGDTQQWGGPNSNQYQQWGNYPSQWSTNDMSEQGDSWQQSESTSSAGSYSYFNKSGGNPNNPQPSWDYGQQSFEYQQQGGYGNQQQKWSTATEDDEWGFNSSGVQQSMLGWESGDQQSEKVQPRREQSGPPAKKRARNDRGARKGKSPWDKFDEYKSNKQSSYNSHDREERAEPDWSEGGFDGKGNFYNEWSQIPQPGYRGSWAGGFRNDVHDEDAMYEHEFGAYQGGYEDPNDNYTGGSEWGNSDRRRRGPRESSDDKILYKKHRTLTQDKRGRKTLMIVVKNVSNALHEASKTMSAELMESLKPKIEVKMGETSEETTKEQNEKETIEENEKDTKEENKKDTKGENEGGKGDRRDSSEKKELPPQVLIGVVRVGPAQRKLITGAESDLGAEFVAVFKEKPTRSYFFKLASLLHQKMRKPLADKVTITPDETNNIISIRPEKSECPYPIVISFTSPEYSPEYQSTLPEDTTEEQVPSKEFLNEEKCMEALAKIRRVRWSLRKIRAEIELPVVRILLDLREAYSGWKHLSPYAAEVLVHLVMEKLAKDVRESELSFSRLFIQCLEVLAEGMALRGGPGMKDPCEAKPVDVFSYLEPQHAEDLTRGAQNALRLASFGRLKELLKMDS